MNKLIVHTLILFIAFVFAKNSYAGKIERGYDALREFNYFKAKEIFENCSKKDITASSFGLAIIYFRNDNPFHSMTEAYNEINIAVDNWGETSEKRKLKWEMYGVTIDSLFSVREKISSYFFENARKGNTVEAYHEFATKNPWAKEYALSIKRRDSLAYNSALDAGNSKAITEYLNMYPESIYSMDAKQSFYETQYYELTKDGLLSSYVNFIATQPESTMVPEAEDKVFQIVTESNTEEAYAVFIMNYPKNKNIQIAWEKMYQVALNEYSKETMQHFLENYPSTPLKSKINKDIELVDSLFLPYTFKERYGFMNSHGEVMIPAVYELSGFFIEGLALVVKDDKYGFINKNGKLQIPFLYESVTDFNNGRSIVELNGKFGMIDRNGYYVFECIYDDLGMFSEGLVFASLNGKYGYYDLRSKLRIPHQFDEAFDFKNGQAKVEINDLQAYVGIYGTYEVPPVYEEINTFYDTLYIYRENDLLGFINRVCKIVVEAKYHEIGELKDGIAVASIGDSLVYIDSLGREVISIDLQVFPNYLSLGEFKNGSAIAVKDGKYGRIDRNGMKITDFKYGNIGLGDEIFPFQSKGLWGVMNKANSVVIKPEFNSLELTGGTFFIANLRDTIGVIDVHRNIIVPFSYNNIEHLKNDIFKVRIGNSYGIYKADSLIIPVEYGQIGIFNNDYLFLNKGDELFYFSIPENRFIEALKKDE